MPPEFGEWLLTVVAGRRTWTALFGYEKDGVIAFLVYPAGEDGSPNVWWSKLFARFEPLSRSDIPEAVYDSLKAWIEGSAGRIRLGE